MGNKIGEVLDSMTANELAALEAELDKRAEALAVGHYYDLGVKMAQEEVAEWNRSGELTPLLHLIKSAAEPSELDLALNKASAEELEAFEKALDSELLAREYAAHYDGCGRKLARELSKEAFGPMITRLGRMAKVFAGRHPMAAGAAMGVGGTLVGQKLLDR